MAFWLLKTEPSVFSYADLEREGKAVWDGVTNNTALIHMRLMKPGDLTLVYHSGTEKQIVGTAEIASDPYPDRKRKDPRFVVVDVVPRQRFANPVPFSNIKGLKEFADWQLVRIPRLSVMPVSARHWKKIQSMSH
jgi:predicted RNA-binding protein with PUA-like domain